MALDRLRVRTNIILLGRPYGSTGGLIFCPWCFFSTPDLRGPSTDRPETLPRDRKLAEFYNSTPKILGFVPPKYLGNMRKYGQFWTTSDFNREYLRKEATYPKSRNVTN